MSFVFSLKNIDKAFGMDTLFSDLSMDFQQKEQIGLIGMNGSGKSTLLKMIAGQEDPDTGEILTQSGLRCIYLPQEDAFDPGLSVEQVLYRSARQYIPDEKEQHRIVKKRWAALCLKTPPPASTPCPAAGKKSWPWPGPCAVFRTCCSWMSPPTIWISTASCGWKTF